MTIDVAPEVRDRVQRQIDSGRFADASEVVARALDALENREKLRVLRELTAKADAEEARGDVVPMSPDFWPSLWSGAGEADERGDPILDHVRLAPAPASAPAPAA